MDSFFSLFDPSNGNSNGYDDNQNDIMDALPPEPQLGNIEYKLKIVNPTKQRFEHLVTQLKWRLREGNGEAIYAIGVEDNGALAGLSEADMTASLQTLKRMASRLGATTSLIREKLLNNQYKISEVLVRKVPEDQNHIEIRLAVLGNADAGKSTLLGVLTQGLLDNGRGRARLNMFRHLHEIQSGRTSSISHEILGFNSEGQPINYSSSELITSQYICDSSRKLITFMDLAGHKKYLRTTIQGLSGYSPHYAMLVISSAAGAVGMAKEHLSIAVALNVPFFIVITKIDLVCPVRTLQTLESFLKQVGSQRVPLIVDNIDDAITAGTKFDDNVVPIFAVSSVTGQGLEELTKFLYLLPPAIGTMEKERLEQDSPEFHIDEHFRAGDVGQILGGLLTKGVINEGTKMQIGPMKDGSFEFVCIKSIHRNRVPCIIVRAGESASICLDRTISGLRNGMVLVSHAGNPKGCLYFQANVSVLSHKTALYPCAQATVHIGNIRQTVVIVGMFSNDALSTNEQDSVLFRFLHHPEYVVVGQKFLLRDGAGKGIGTVTQIFPLSSSDLGLKF